MIRLAILLVVVAAAFVALLVHMLGGDSEARSMREKLLRGEVDEIARGEGPRGPSPLPRDRPRGAGDVLLQVSLPADDPRAARGGEILISLRGNLAIFRRMPGALHFERVTAPRDRVEAVLAEAAARPSGAAGGSYRLSWDLGDARGEAPLSEDEFLGIYGRLAGRIDAAWRPPGLRLRVSVHPLEQGEDLPPWPAPPFPPPAEFAEGRDATFLGAQHRAIASMLEQGAAAREAERIRIESFLWLLP